MNNEQPFIDLYQIMEVRSKCSAKTLEAAYRRLTKIYHPDNAETSDVEKFNDVVAAYKILRKPEDRAKYDERHKKNVRSEKFQSPLASEMFVDEDAAVTDAEAHEDILRALYKYRRENAENPGVLAFYIKEFLKCPDEIFEFHVWYLKSKGYIERTEQGTLAITVQGVDHVIALSRTSIDEQLLIAGFESRKSAPDA